jgi:two-component system alkaline phosphatase synthesis response regulator PhoP
VLVVEDEPDIARIIGLALKLIGRWYVVTCHQAAEIDAAVASSRPDLILMDRLLSGTDGLEVCKKLKAAPQTAAIPVIFLSAKCTDNDLAEGMAAGAAGYLAKPFDPMELADRVKSILASNN